MTNIFNFEWRWGEYKIYPTESKGKIESGDEKKDEEYIHPCSPHYHAYS